MHTKVRCNALDISATAAGQSDVLVQWSWTGNYEYYWLMDDYALYDSDPSQLFLPANDMQVNENFFAIAPYAQWPVSQTFNMNFLADVENNRVLDLLLEVAAVLSDDEGDMWEFENGLFYQNLGGRRIAPDKYTVKGDIIDLDGYHIKVLEFKGTYMKADMASFVYELKKK